ncbi:MAG: hypothetical protein QUU85_08475, partial [Candidatus Eisenbacteria bacterium]|nr:hypothetical protein [Candidatus Eisenbacteria bacterium]
LSRGLGDVYKRQTDGGASWQLRADCDDLDADLFDVMVLGPGQLLAIGSSPGIFRSTDGGASWTPVVNPSTRTLKDLKRVGGSILSAAGEHGEIVRSTDDGATWSLRNPPSDATIEEQFWLTDTHGYVVGDLVARETTNGGTTWQTIPGVPEGDFYGEVVFAADQLHGWILADFQTYATTDGGASWTQSSVPLLLVYQCQLLPVTAQHLYLAIDLEGAKFFESTDGGAHWQMLLDEPDTNGYPDFERLSNGDLIVCSTFGDLHRSTDNGQSWQNATYYAGDGPRVVISAFGFTPGGRVFAGSTPPGNPYYRWHRSEDEGRTWSEASNTPPIMFLNDIEFVDDALGYAGGNGGTQPPSSIWRTTDGGDSWSARSLPNSAPNGVSPLQIVAPSASRAYCTTYGQSTTGLIFRSTDGGTTWAQCMTGLPASYIWTIAFLDEQNGYAGGGSQFAPYLYRTTNGGTTWTAMPTAGLPSFVRTMVWFDAQTAVVGSESDGAGIYRTTNGGTTWAPVLQGPVRRIGFSDALHGVAMRSFALGYVYVTGDGGQTWEPLDLPLSSWAETVEARPNGFFVGAGGSSIIEATRHDPASIGDGESQPGAVPSAPGLLRAIRPVGDRPLVALQLPSHGKAVLTIHELAGRRIATLAAGTFSAGASVEREWAGKDDSGRAVESGVYFARLSTHGGPGASVKLVLLH